MADIPSKPIKGRGAVSNLANRFEKVLSETFDDGWWREELEDSVATQVQPDPARSIISRNQSPDIPFSQSINPYKGCEHGCVYCLSGDTPILYADGTYRPLKDVRIGDRIIGTVREGWYRRYAETEVQNHWATKKPAYRITLADGTQLVSSGDHRFLTERGWKFVTRIGPGRAQRPHLTMNNKLMGTGQFVSQPRENEEYRRGYLCGMIRGDGHLGSYRYSRAGRTQGDVHRFRLALTDLEALHRSRDYLTGFGINTREFVFQPATEERGPMHAIRTSARHQVECIKQLIAFPSEASDDWLKGFLAGIYDAEGHLAKKNIVRISNSDAEIIRHICMALDHFGFGYVLEPIERNGRKSLTVVRLNGGLAKILTFFHLTGPAIRRKCSITGTAIKSDVNLRVRSIEALDCVMTMYDITTGTGDFIANGVVSHNCFARPTHSYLDLSPGLDFETKLFYKQNAPELLREAFRRRSYQCSPIALGINTDAYQPIERQYRITRQLLEVLLEHRHPVSLLTKSALIERDLDILSEMAQHRLVAVMVSMTSLDPAIKRTLEPRTASPQARLRVLRSLSEAGIPTGVMVAPVIPVITDPEMESILAAAAEAGAVRAGYVLLRLPWEVKDLFRQWLEAHHPLKTNHVMSIIRQSRGGKDYDSRWGQRGTGTGKFAELLMRRFYLACKKLELNREGFILDISQFQPPPRPGDQISLF